MDTTATITACGAAAIAANPGGRLSTYLMGLVLDGMLQGVAMLQFARWCEHSFSKDRLTVKVLAIWVFLAGSGYTCLQTARVLHIFAFHFGSYCHVLENTMALWLIVILLLVHLPVQGFFVSRAFLLSGKSKILLGALTTMMLAVASTAVTVFTLFPRVTLHWIKVEINMLVALSSLLAATDVTITLCCMVFLWRRRSDRAETNRLIRKLVILSAESQLPPSLFAVMVCVTDATGHISQSPVFVALMCKTSVVTFLSVLNARRAIRKEMLPQLTPEPPASDNKDEAYIQGNGLSVLPVVSYSASLVNLPPTPKLTNSGSTYSCRSPMPFAHMSPGRNTWSPTIEEEDGEEITVGEMFKRQ